MRPSNPARILIFLVLIYSFAHAACSGIGNNPPNIVVFLSDDMHWHNPGFNGGLADTPNLDRLAEQGRLFPSMPYTALLNRLEELTRERRQPETHANLTNTIEQPLLVFGKEENENPPEWLADYLRLLPPTKKEQQRAVRTRNNNEN